MNPHNDEEMIWQRLSRALFGGRTTSDEGLFTYRVMEEIRKMDRALEDLAWPRFLRWALPMLGAGAASLVLAARAPVPSPSFLIDTALFHKETPAENPLTPILDGLR